MQKKWGGVESSFVENQQYRKDKTMKKTLLLVLSSVTFFSYAHDEGKQMIVIIECEQVTIDRGGELYDAYERAKKALPEKQVYDRALAEHARYRDDIKRALETTSEGRAVLQSHTVLPNGDLMDSELPEHLTDILDRTPGLEMENYLRRLEDYKKARSAYIADRENSKKKAVYDRASIEHARYRDAIKGVLEVTPEGRAVLQDHMILPTLDDLDLEISESDFTKIENAFKETGAPEMENYLKKLQDYEKARDAYYAAHDALPEQRAWNSFLEANAATCSEEQVKRAYYSKTVKEVINRYSGLDNESQSNVNRRQKVRKIRKNRGSGKGVQ